MRVTFALLFAAIAALAVAREFHGERAWDKYSHENEVEHKKHSGHHSGHHGHNLHERETEPVFKEASWWERLQGKKHNHHDHHPRSMPHEVDDVDFDDEEEAGPSKHRALHHHQTDGHHGHYGHPIDEYADFHSREGHHGPGPHMERDTETVDTGNEFFDASELEGYDLGEDDDDDAAIAARYAGPPHNFDPHHHVGHKDFQDGDRHIFAREEVIDAAADEGNSDQEEYYDAGDDGDNAVSDDSTDYPGDDSGGEGYESGEHRHQHHQHPSGTNPKSPHPSHSHGHPTVHKTPEATKRGWNLFPW